MKYRPRLCADQDMQRRPGQRVPPVADPPAGEDAGTAGLCWLWGLVELRLSQAEPDSAA